MFVKFNLESYDDFFLKKLGESYVSLGVQFVVGETTVTFIVQETCTAITSGTHYKPY